MREMLLVLGRELNERVRTRSFAIGTLLFPIFMVAILLLPSISGDGGRERRLVVVSDAPAQIAQTFAIALNQEYSSPIDSLLPDRRKQRGRYQLEHRAGPIDPLRAQLTARIEAEEIDGYVYLPADVRDHGEVQFRSTRLADPAMLREIRLAATEAVQADRLMQSGLKVEMIADLLEPVSLDDGRVDERGNEAGTAQASFYFAYIVAIVIYMMIAMYGTGVTRSVLEEKNNRIAEILVSSVRATHLMTGKILGVGAAVMLQLFIWIATILLLITQSEWLAERFDIDPSALNVVASQPVASLLLIAYFVLGFLLFAALFAALGAAVTTDQEAQSFQMLFMLPLFVPLLFLMQLTTHPLEPLARTLGLIPFTSPVAMPMRMAAARIPIAEILLSLGLLAITTVATTWAAARIYRIGILATGRKPALIELLRWLRVS